MSAKTKIVVLHMKEVVYTGLFIALGVLLIVLLVTLFLPSEKKRDTSVTENETPTAEPISQSLYLPGVYTTELVLGGETVDVEVIVSQDAISSVQLKNLSDAVTTMYPLLTPTFENICEQIYESQSVENITYAADNKYTSLVLTEAIRHSLEKAYADAPVEP